MRQGEKVHRALDVKPLGLSEDGEHVGQFVFHARGIVAIHKEGSGKPPEHKVQGALASPAVLMPGSAGFDPVGGQGNGDLSTLSGTVMSVICMPGCCMGLR